MSVDRPNFGIKRRTVLKIGGVGLAAAIFTEYNKGAALAQPRPDSPLTGQDIDKWRTFIIPDTQPTPRINASEFQSERVGLRDLNIYVSREFGIAAVRFSTDMVIVSSVDPLQKPWFQPVDIPFVPAPTVKNREINHELIPEEIEQEMLYEVKTLMGGERSKSIITSILPRPLSYVPQVLWIPEGALIDKENNPLPLTYLRARFVFNQSP